MKSNKIAIIGSGQLGSRHLQSLSRLEQNFQIFLVDPSEAALNTALGRFNEVNDKTERIKVSLLTQIGQLPAELDIAIIACNSLQRRVVLEQLFKNTKCNYLVLEKFLFPSLDDYDAVNNLFEENKATAWVNCSRRMYSDYQKLKELLKQEKEINMQVSAGQLALGSNAIHYIDLFNFLGAPAITNIQTDALKQKIFTSKREGYVEFYGTLKVAAGNSFLSITSFEESNMPLSISITTPNLKIYIQESLSPFVSIFKKEESWKQINESFTIQHQSELTQLAVTEILNSANCSLPFYDESATIHKLLLKSYLDFYNSLTGKSNKLCPIT